jgi:hypothetical protein
MDGCDAETVAVPVPAGDDVPRLDPLPALDAAEWKVPEVGVAVSDVRNDPLVLAARAALHQQRLDDLESIHKRVQTMRIANRRPNTMRGYAKCWRLWEVGTPTASYARVPGADASP